MTSGTPAFKSTLEDKIYGCLLGGLIGDAMGALTEGTTFQQISDQFGPDGVTDFEGVGTDHTAIREQLIDAIVKAELEPSGSGRVTCDEFAQSFRDHRAKNYRLWYATQSAVAAASSGMLARTS